MSGQAFIALLSFKMMTGLLNLHYIITVEYWRSLIPYRSNYVEFVEYVMCHPASFTFSAVYISRPVIVNKSFVPEFYWPD